MSRIVFDEVGAGAPVGDKNADSVRGLPDWVDEAPMVVKMELALLFVRGRGAKQGGKATRQLTSSRA